METFFFNWGVLFPGDPNLYQVDKKLDSSKDSQENASANIMVNNDLSFLYVRN